MTLQECYTALGGDYDEVLGRLRSESLVQKFVLKFPADPSYDMLQTALAAQDWAEAFRGVPEPELHHPLPLQLSALRSPAGGPSPPGSRPCRPGDGRLPGHPVRHPGLPDPAARLISTAEGSDFHECI